MKFLTHKNCMDGSVCAILYVLNGGRKEDIIFSNPNHVDVDEKVLDLIYKEDGPIIITDLSISDEVAQKCSIRKDIFLYDHHESASNLKNYSWCVIDKNKCGCMIYYSFLISQNNINQNILNYKRLVELADDYDRWIHSTSDSKLYNTLHNIYGQKRFIDRFLSNPSITLSSNELYLLDLEISKKQEFIEENLKNVEIYTINVTDKGGDKKQIRFGFTKAYQYQSEIGDKMCNNFDIDVAVIIGLDKISMRSKKNGFDVSKLAEKYGGGGHKNAGGCSLSNLIGKDLISLVKDSFKFNNLDMIF